MKAIVTVGLPGSGKSTWAAQSGLTIVERDIIRRSLVKNFSWETWDFSLEDKVSELWTKSVRQSADECQDIVVADTHLIQKNRRESLEVIMGMGYEIEVALFDIPAAVCQERNLRRPRDQVVLPQAFRKMEPEFYRSRQTLAQECSALDIPLRVIVLTDQESRQVCGGCLNFKRSGDTHYGYCEKNRGSSMRNILSRARLVTALTPCWCLS